jgi:glycosidase
MAVSQTPNGVNGMQLKEPWWKTSTFYQIYPASFKDSNGDGIGDIPGILESLDYIKSLGVDAIWLSPMYDSPQVDMGYDVADYEKVYPPYGTMQDMEDLIEQCHKRDMKLILDLVINHTSDLHAWFQESKSSPDSPKRDWYIWRPAKYVDGVRKPPTNWQATFGGSAWTWVETMQAYYLHLFCPEQPDLNWENEETRKAIYASAMTFWLEKGVDGFRVDTVNMYSKPTNFQDAPMTLPHEEFQPAHDIYCNGPRMHEFLREMYDVLAPYNAMTVGELPHTPDPKEVLSYVSAKAKQLSMVFQFDICTVGSGTGLRYDVEPRDWKVSELREAIINTQNMIGSSDGWSTTFLENHDQARSISRYCCDSTRWRNRSGKMLAVLVATLSGTLFLYEGQEIGMINVPLSWGIEEYKDVDSQNYYQHVAEETGGDPEALAKAMRGLQYLCRDNARTPMQWTSGRKAGFSTGKPWMRVNDSYTDINVAQEEKDKDSILNFWRKMLEVRKAHAELLIHGDFTMIDDGDERILQFTKQFEDAKALVACNFSNEEGEYKAVDGSKLLLSNVDKSTGATMQPYEARIYLID